MRMVRTHTLRSLENEMRLCFAAPLPLLIKLIPQHATRFLVDIAQLHEPHLV